jgi:hypothetical protein
MIYGIIGGGTHPQNVIEDGLKDIYFNDPENTLFIWCRTGASESEKRVYSWVLDNDIPFNAVVVGGAAPKVMLEAADYIHYSEDAAETIIKEVAAGNGTVLILWDNEQERHMNEIVVRACDYSLAVKELSNGLTPIIVDAEPITKTTDSPQRATEVEMEPLSKEELDEMSIGLLKKAAFAQGIADAGGMSKAQLVDTLAGYEKFIAASDVPTREMPEYGQGQLTWIEDGELRSVMLGESFVKRFLEDLRYKPN